MTDCKLLTGFSRSENFADIADSSRNGESVRDILKARNGNSQYTVACRNFVRRMRNISRPTRSTRKKNRVCYFEPCIICAAQLGAALRRKRAGTQNAKSFLRYCKKHDVRLPSRETGFSRDPVKT